LWRGAGGEVKDETSVCKFARVADGISCHRQCSARTARR
jgi:hypothetical protein